jgi:methylmalonyl-CoA/ethylmalonyl-CoA epimerase
MAEKPTTSASLADAFGLTFHHLGLAVAKPETARAFLSKLGYQIGPAMLDPVQNVHLAMCDHTTMPSVEIIWPAQGKGPLDRYLKEHREGLVYHMAFAAKDLAASIAALKADPAVRAIFWAEPQEAILFQGRKIVFCIVNGVGLIELVAEHH